LYQRVRIERLLIQPTEIIVLSALCVTATVENLRRLCFVAVRELLRCGSSAATGLAGFARCTIVSRGKVS
jgi:hypothetical protein